MNTHLIATPFGKVLVKVNASTNTSEIVDASTLKPLARIHGTSRRDFTLAIRRIVTLTRLNLDMQSVKMELLGGFENPMEQPKPVKPAPQPTPTIVKRKAGRPKKDVAAQAAA
jgi:hypothetical protein